ncbi:MAG: holo-ACP synthase [Deltaproteobacteria bacterium]
MIRGLGIDVVEVARIRRLLGEEARAGTAERFLARCFTDSERRFCDGRADRENAYAARFAAKEATSKALGAPAGIRWTDVEVERGEGAPTLRLSGVADRVARERGVDRVHLSLTHDGGIAAAVVVLEGGRE